MNNKQSRMYKYDQETLETILHPVHNTCNDNMIEAAESFGHKNALPEIIVSCDRNTQQKDSIQYRPRIMSRLS